MNNRKYGKLGFDASLFGMGCMRLPRRQREDGTVEIDREKAIELIRYAADHGSTTLIRPLATIGKKRIARRGSA